MIKIDDVQIILNNESEGALRNDIIDKVTFLLTCIKGTIPMNREIGLNPDILSSSSFLAQNLYTISAIELIEKFEPRVSVEEILFVSSDTTGKIIPKVVLQYNVQ